LYFPEGNQKIMAQISNHKPVNTNSGSPFFNLSRIAKATCTHGTIKAIVQHRQEYQHQYSREEKLNNLVNVANRGENGADTDE
jgi:hypothetical protein